MPPGRPGVPRGEPDALELRAAFDERPTAGAAAMEAAPGLERRAGSPSWRDTRRVSANFAAPRVLKIDPVWTLEVQIGAPPPALGFPLRYSGVGVLLCIRGASRGHLLRRCEP